MKKTNLFLGMILVVGLMTVGCGTKGNSSTTRVEQNGTQTESTEGMQATAPNTAESKVTEEKTAESEVVTEKTTDTANQENESENTAEITEQKAKEIALQDAKVSENDVKGMRVERDVDDGRHQYEVDFYAGDKEYDYDIDLYSGEILSRDYEIEDDFEYEQTVDSSKYISEEEAIQIVLNRVKGATKKQIIIELEEDDGKLIYEGEVHYNNKEYEFELNAENGDLLEWKEEAAHD